MSTKDGNGTALPGIDLNKEGFRHEKRRPMSTKQQVQAYIERNTSIIAGQVSFEPRDFRELVQQVYDSAYNIGLEEGRRLTEWNARMQ